jgi:hypothetical protein
MPVAGRRGIASALVADDRGFVIDCGRGAPSAFVDAALDFRCLEAVFVAHLHADHVGDLPGMLLYGWGVRTGAYGPLPLIRVYGPGSPGALPSGGAVFHRQTTIDPDRPVPGTTDLVQSILAGYAYDLNVMPLDARMPDAGALVRAVDIPVPAPANGHAREPLVVVDDGGVRVTAVAVTVISMLNSTTKTFASDPHYQALTRGRGAAQLVRVRWSASGGTRFLKRSSRRVGSCSRPTFPRSTPKRSRRLRSPAAWRSERPSR